MAFSDVKTYNWLWQTMSEIDFEEDENSFDVVD